MAKKRSRKHKGPSVDPHAKSQPQRCFKLDWTQISGTQQNFIDMNCILSMLCSQLQEDSSDNDDAEQSRDTDIEEDEDDFDFDEDIFDTWQLNTADQRDKNKAEVAEAARKSYLKNRFLDRLAEVLARARKPPEGVRQIASAYMAEIDYEDGSQGVEVRLAKNEGLSGEDDRYLKLLFEVLMKVARDETSVEEAREMLLQQTLTFAQKRVNFYVESCRNDFRRDSRVQPSAPSRLQKLVTATAKSSRNLNCWSDWPWRDYDFGRAGSVAVAQNDAGDDIEMSSRKANEENCTDVKRVIAALFQRVLTFCRTPEPSLGHLAEIIKSALILQTDVKSRIWLQQCFLEHFGGAFEAALRARRALLFLCRFYAAIVTFTDAASQLPSFQNMSFRFVEPLPLESNIQHKSAEDVLVGLGVRGNNKRMTKFWKGERNTAAKVIEDFENLRQEPCHVHAEIQLVDDFESRRDDSGWRVHPYIGGSKLCCYLCEAFLRRHGFFHYRGGHWKIYHRWSIPEASVTRNTALIFENALRVVHHEVVKHVKSIMKGDEQPMKTALRPESTVDLSSAATVSALEMSEMTLPSPSSKWMGKGAFGPSVMDDAVLVVPNFEKPGRMTVCHYRRFAEMSIEDAEIYKDKFERSKLLRKMKEPIKRRCHQPLCRTVPTIRCKACRTPYCSRKCQTLDWHRHVFHCTVRGRPNLADSLALLIRDAGDPGNPKCHDLLRNRLFADTDLATVFGFSGCRFSEEVDSLIYIYKCLTVTKRSALMLQGLVDHGELEEKIRGRLRTMREQHPNSRELFPDATELFRKRNWDRAAYVEDGIHRAMALLKPQSPNDEEKVTNAEKKVFRLYAHLLRDFEPSR